jgi:hypothetical protein
MTRNQQIDAINDKIRAAVYAIGDAEFAGLRGEAMLAVKRNLLVLKAQHKAIMATR